MAALIRTTYFSIIYIFILNIFNSDGAGIGTHIEVGERIRNFLDLNSDGVDYGQLIRRHPDAFEAGCPYPDSYWSGICYDGIYRNVSESTHWTPFVEATVNYIRDNYPRPWNETGEKLVAFLMGVVAHQVADVTWHSHYIEQGFVRSMGSVNYHDSYDDSHSDADLGSDVMNHYQLPIDFLSTEWYIPVDDLVAIYDIMDGGTDILDIEAHIIENCTKIMYLGILGENLGLLEYLYPYHGSRSPFLRERLNDWFLGGMDDIATWIGNIIGHTVTMLDHGTSECYLPCPAIYIECNDTNTAISKQEDQFCAPNYEPDSMYPDVDSDWRDTLASLVHDDDYVIEENGAGITFRASEHYKRRLRELERDNENEPVLGSVSAFYSTDETYSRLGEVLLSGDVNGDSDLDLIISAPGYSVAGNYQKGRVYVVYGTPTGLPTQNLTLERDADLILEAPKPNGRFGSALELLDINADGYSDLVISAPSVGSSGLTYHGEVYIYFSTLGGISMDPDVTITCSEHYCNLGTTLTSGDVTSDGMADLLIGAPFAPSGGEQRGFVGVIYASSQISGGDLTEDSLDWRYNGTMDYEWFGYSLTSVNTSATTGQLIIGSPTQRMCNQTDCSYDYYDVQSVGKVTTFITPVTGGPDQVVMGNISMAQLGANVRGHQQGILAIAATTQDHVDIDPDVNNTVERQLGQVTIYDWSDTTWQEYFTVIGDREFSSFGAEIQYADVNGDSMIDFIIASPLRSESFGELREEGRVYVFYNDESKRGLTLIADQADMILSLGVENGRYGYSMAAVTTSTNQVQLAVSSPYINYGGRLSGLVTVHEL